MIERGHKRKEERGESDRERNEERYESGERVIEREQNRIMWTEIRE